MNWQIHMARVPGMSGWTPQATGRPLWVYKAALAAAGILMLGLIVALLVGAVTYTLLSTFASLTSGTSGSAGQKSSEPEPPLRENVRVIHRR